MTTLELADIQGNILLGYRLPVARYTFLTIGDADSGRRFIRRVLPDVLAGRVAWLEGCCRASGDVEVAGTQDAAALVIDGQPTSKEHFGYTDGYGNPAVLGAPERSRSARGRGKMADGDWQPIATGEFVLGHRDEGQELPRAPVPATLSRNGTFMVYRKLHQNVASFRQFIEQVGAAYPGGPHLLGAKLIGRWADGTPLALSPDRPDRALAEDV